MVAVVEVSMSLIELMIELRDREQMTHVLRRSLTRYSAMKDFFLSSVTSSHGV